MTSAKTGYQIEEVFKVLAEEILSHDDVKLGLNDVSYGSLAKEPHRK